MLCAHKPNDQARHQGAAHTPRAAAVTSARRPTTVTLPDTLLREARELGITLSQACERGLSAEVANPGPRGWLEQNARRHGLFYLSTSN